MAWPDDLTDTLITPAATDYMDDTGKEGDVVIARLVALIRAFIAEFGANPSAAAATLAARLDAFLPTTGGTISGPITFAGTGADLTLAANPTDAMHAATKQYVDARADALFPGGTQFTALANRDTPVYDEALGKWVNVPSGL